MTDTSWFALANRAAKWAPTAPAPYTHIFMLCSLLFALTCENLSHGVRRRVEWEPTFGTSAHTPESGPRCAWVAYTRVERSPTVGSQITAPLPIALPQSWLTAKVVEYYAIWQRESQCKQNTLTTWTSTWSSLAQG
jgi:hypothetical protein